MQNKLHEIFYDKETDGKNFHDVFSDKEVALAGMDLFEDISDLLIASKKVEKNNGQKRLNSCKYHLLMEWQHHFFHHFLPSLEPLRKGN